MPERSSYTPGTPSWVDVLTSDLDGAKAFYGDLFGWDAEDQVDDGVRVYTMFRLRGRSVAGGGEMAPEQRDAGMPSLWTTYVSVADADAAAAAADAEGGEVLMDPMDVLGAGRMTTLTDPAGAMLSLWEPGEHIGAELVNEPGTLAWNELAVRDPGAVVPFYRRLFGWEIVEQELPDGSIYRELSLGGTPVGGIIEMGPGWPDDMPPHWMTYFAADDCANAAEQVVELGGEVHVPPTDTPSGLFSVVADPQGAIFTVIEFAADRS